MTTKDISEQVLEHYLTSGDFNGFGTSLITDANEIAKICELITDRKIDLVRGDGHPNPHIKAFEAEPVATQLKKIEKEGLAGCLYPTSEYLNKHDAGANETGPYTRELMEGVPQLVFRAFDLRAFEWYRNDPRFEFDVDDIHGRIIQKPDTDVAGRVVLKDKLTFFEFGFAYNEENHRAAAAFVRYLHDLPPELQIEIKNYELSNDYKLHPDFYRTQIIGDFPERMSVYDAFLEEKIHINKMCELLGKPKLFRTEFDELKRPVGFGILMRPTKKEFRDFSLQLDQLLSDDLNRDFFKGDIEMNRRLTNDAGAVETFSKGTIQLLEEWLASKFKPAEPKPVQEMFANFRAVRKERQKPAHKLEDNEFDQQFLFRQRELISKAYGAVHTLRMVLENHPLARNYDVPDHIREAKVWMM